jgi:alpha-L-fucosidase
VEAALQHGHPAGAVWRPAEVDVSIRPGWFHHPAQDGAVRTMENLTELYFTSVGRNAKLLLNVPPTREGLVHEVDAARLMGFRADRERLFAAPLPIARGEWRSVGPRGARAEWTLRRPVTPTLARLAENIERGQLVARYTLQGGDGRRWRTLSSGTTIGHAKLDRLAGGMPLHRVRLVVEDAVAAPGPVSLQLFGDP